MEQHDTNAPVTSGTDDTLIAPAILFFSFLGIAIGSVWFFFAMLNETDGRDVGFIASGLFWWFLVVLCLIGIVKAFVDSKPSVSTAVACMIFPIITALVVAFQRKEFHFLDIIIILLMCGCIRLATRPVVVVAWAKKKSAEFEANEKALTCPHCGGRLPNTSVTTCMHCGKDIRRDGNADTQEYVHPIDAPAN